jgi:5-hydroxyisourate hydrolase-like protein (transthyretin family)
MSNNNFAISSGTTSSITVTSPNGGESWQRGISKTITWSSSGSPGANVKIDLYKAGVFKQTIVSSTPNDGSQSWYVPTTQTLGTDYKIKVTSTSNSAYADMSNNNFIIGSGTSITVTSPNGGENWQRGTTKTITWSKLGSPGANVKIDLYKAGVFKQTIVASTPNDGSQTWTIPAIQTLGTDYKIKVTSTSNGAYTDMSNNNFMIGSPTSITVTSPNGGENWQRGTTKTITWSKLGNPGANVKIDLYKAGVFKQTIVASTPNDGSQTWTIPWTVPIGSDYKINIKSVSNSAYGDLSNNYFKIY